MKTVMQDSKGNFLDEKGNIIAPAKNSTETPKILEVAEIQPKTPEELKNPVVLTETPKITKPKMYSKYEVKPDTVFEVRFGIMMVDGRWTVISENDAEITKGAEKHWVKFRMWNFLEEMSWKSQCMEYDMVRRVNSLNQDRLNDTKLRNLLLDWSFSENDNSLKLLHVNGILSDEGLKMFYALYPSIVRYVITRMNDILEYNG